MWLRFRAAYRRIRLEKIGLVTLLYFIIRTYRISLWSGGIPGRGPYLDLQREEGE